MKLMRLPILALLVVAFSACSRQIHVYVPNQVNAPLLKEKNEFKGNVSLTNWQAAYSVSDNIAIMANGQYVWRGFWANDENGEEDIIDKYTRGGLIEGGVGYFKALGTSKKAVFEVYAGYGNGAFKTMDESFTRDSVRFDHQLRTRFHKFFVQPSFGLSHKVVEAAVSTRFSVLNFYNPTLGPKAFQDNPDERANFLKMDGRTVPFMEPAFTIRVGYRYVKWQAQFMFSVPLVDETYNNDYNLNNYYQNVSFTTGVSLNFGQWVNDMKKR